MFRTVLALTTALFLFTAPVSASAHCGSCDSAAGDGHPACAFCAGDATAECTCNHGEDEATDDGHANCAFCSGDRTAECTCNHDEEEAVGGGSYENIIEEQIEMLETNPTHRR
jgi:hypothetical protein